MKYSATALECNPKYEVIDVILTPDRLSVDWDEDGARGHLDANSSDGQIYLGRYGYPQLDAACTVRLCLFRADAGALLLFGSWHDRDGSKGTWLIHLLPELTKQNEPSYAHQDHPPEPPGSGPAGNAQ